jgi:RNA polymerase sigma factor (sigma-70 family)
MSLAKFKILWRIPTVGSVMFSDMSDTDMELLARYTRHRDEDAFAEIVRRHLGLVYSAAMRQVRSPQLAEEVSQSVFIKLADEASRLKSNTILTAWLYQVTRRAAIDVVRREASRQLREKIATEMNAMNATAADWTDIEPLLDEAMYALDDTDRTAVLLRYFENKSLREVGVTLGTSENAAQKRLGRAVERLREFFAKRGVTVGASGLVVVISANAVQAAPVGMAISISTSAGTTLAVTANATKGGVAGKAAAAAILTSAIVSQEVVATHFDLMGRPNGWMDRSTYFLFSVALGIGLPLFLIGLGYVTRFLSARFINIPNRDYWLARERRARTCDFLFRHLLWLACFVAIFMVGVHLSIAYANRQVPPHLSSSLFWGLFGSFLVTVIIWAGILSRRFKRDAASPCG